MASKLKLKPRKYQAEAAKWALRKQQAVVCMPTGTGKTLVAAIWIKSLLDEGKVKRVLVLEPTRFLVEQISHYLRRYAGLDARPLHGSLPASLRKEAWDGKIVVATPEIILVEDKTAREIEFDALVVDECHHTTGQDPFKIVVNNYNFKYKLGLTALVPPSRKRDIEESIGPIKCWGWNHPEVSKYIPEWVSEVYEAPLNKYEEQLYNSIENIFYKSRGIERVLLSAALRWYVRDGAEALRETYYRSKKIRKLLSETKEILFSKNIRKAHKLGHLLRVLRDHEVYDKAIIFVDRVIIAKLIADTLGRTKTALLLGRRNIDPKVELAKAKDPGIKHIVASSAGEEGIDLPEADLLIIWSNTSSPLRFVQRLGRVLRATEHRKQKYVVFIVTPETIDVDTLLDSFAKAERIGIHVNISRNTIERLIGLSKRRKIIEILGERPLPEDLIARALSYPLEIVRSHLYWLSRNGYIGYIYTWHGRVYFDQSEALKLLNLYPEELTPRENRSATIIVYLPGGTTKKIKSKDYNRIYAILSELIDKYGSIERIRASIMVMEKNIIKMKNISYNFQIRNKATAYIISRNILAIPLF